MVVKYTGGGDWISQPAFIVPVAALTADPRFAPGPNIGRVVQCDDGQRYYSNGLTWVAFARASAGGTGSALTALKTPFTLTVGAGGDFATLREAVEEASAYIPAQDSVTNFKIVLMILSGYVQEEQIVISGRDLSFVEIRSEDAEVSVDASVFNTEWTEDDYALFYVRSGALPVIRTVFTQMPGSPAGVGVATYGLVIDGGGSAAIYGVDDTTPYYFDKWAGFKGFDRNVTVNHVSSSIVAWGANLSDAARVGLAVSGLANVFATNINGCGIASIELNGGTLRVGAGRGPGYYLPDPTLYCQDFRIDPAVDSQNDVKMLSGMVVVRRSDGVPRFGSNISRNRVTPDGYIQDPVGEAQSVVGLLFPQSYTVATLPSAAASTGAQVYVTDGAAGLPIMAFSDGTDWLRCDTRAAVAAS